jgi:hypothetical protein
MLQRQPFVACNLVDLTSRHLLSYSPNIDWPVFWRPAAPFVHESRGLDFEIKEDRRHGIFVTSTVRRNTSQSSLPLCNLANGLTIGGAC